MSFRYARVFRVFIAPVYAGAVRLFWLPGRAALAQTAAPAADRDGEKFFEEKIRPLLVARCYKCHSHEAKKVQGQLYLDSRPGWQKGGESGPAIVPGKSEESLI